MPQQLLFILLLVCAPIVCNGNNITENKLWKQAQFELDNSNYDKAIAYYDELSQQVDSTYKAINSEQIEDLRELYSTDKLKIENKQRKTQLLNYVFRSLLFMMAVLIGFYSFFRYQKNKLMNSQEDLNKAKAAAENSIKNKSLFLSNMSHEIRTPLNALSGFSSVLIEPGIDDTTRKQCNEIIQLNSRLLLDLINDIVDLSCIDLEIMNFNIKKCNVVDLCQNIVNTLEGIKQTQADIKYKSLYPALCIETDTVRLQQVLINLLVNATKFTKQGSITLSIEKVNNHMLQFSITDTGCGIPLDKQGKIFERYEKLNEKAQGTGIGLSLCYTIINRLGGKIWIDPEYTEGTRFAFTHPLTQSKES